jgi:TldD protein
MLALDAAKSAGADYADVRFSRNRSQNIFTRERRVQGLNDSDTVGFRRANAGRWILGLCREQRRIERGVARVAKQAAAQAKANRLAQLKPVILAPAPATPNGECDLQPASTRSPVAIEDKVALLLAANEAALK